MQIYIPSKTQILIINNLFQKEVTTVVLCALKRQILTSNRQITLK